MIGELECQVPDTVRDKTVVVDIVWKEKAGLYEEETGREGSYVLRTDRVDLSDKEIWETYNMLRQIEYRLCQKGDHRSWRTIRNILKTHERLPIEYKWHGSNLT